jgi:hypothetical protein
MNKIRWILGFIKDEQDQGSGFKEDESGGEIWVS